MTSREVNAITGAFSYTGKVYHSAAAGTGEKRFAPLPDTLTIRTPFGEQVQVYPFNFDQPHKLVESLKGVTTLYNTYWIRFSHDSTYV
jgi:NADH dehydrogenase